VYNATRATGWINGAHRYFLCGHLNQVAQNAVPGEYRYGCRHSNTWGTSFTGIFEIAPPNMGTWSRSIYTAHMILDSEDSSPYFGCVYVASHMSRDAVPTNGASTSNYVGVYRSCDGAVTWQWSPLRFFNQWWDDSEPVISTSTGGVVHAVWAEMPGQIMYTNSTDGGVSWQTPTILSTAWGLIDIQIDIDNHAYGYPGTSPASTARAHAQVSASAYSTGVHVVWLHCFNTLADVATTDVSCKVMYRRSDDSGGHWTDIAVLADGYDAVPLMPALATTRNNQGVAIGMYVANKRFVQDTPHGIDSKLRWKYAAVYSFDGGRVWNTQPEWLGGAFDPQVTIDYQFRKNPNHIGLWNEHAYSTAAWNPSNDTVMFTWVDSGNGVVCDAYYEYVNGNRTSLDIWADCPNPRTGRLDIWGQEIGFYAGSWSVITPIPAPINVAAAAAAATTTENSLHASASGMAGQALHSSPSSSTPTQVAYIEKSAVVVY
jgi:hypothetical protein